MGSQWQSEQFGTSHQGRPAALLADGTEPKPMVFDTGSSGSMHETSDWWVYDGTLRAPLASHLTSACSCGWRGAHQYPIDWSCGADTAYETDTSRVFADWQQHIEDVDARAVPLPTGMEGLLEQLEEQLATLADQAPLAALKAVARLERTCSRAAYEATGAVHVDGLSWETVAGGLGLTEREARSRLTGYALRH